MLLLAGAACSPPPGGVEPAADPGRGQASRAPATVAGVVGCYQMGEWRFGLDSVPAATYWTTLREPELQAWSYRPRAHGDLSWKITPAGEVMLREENGMDGSISRLRPDGVNLKGLLWWSADVMTGARPPERVRALRIPCAQVGEDTTAGPPVNPEQLRVSLTRGVADVLIDSLQPPVAGTPVLFDRGAPYFTAIVSSLVSVRAARAQNPPYGVRLVAEPDSMSRNAALVTVTIAHCHDAPPPNLDEERVRYRLRRSSSGWRLLASEHLGQTQGRCGAPRPNAGRP